MASVERVEKSIRKVEGFRVSILYSTPGPAKGRNVRGDRTNVKTYRYQRAAPGDWTVNEWIEKRFEAEYPGFSVEVLDDSGAVVSARKRLRGVRETTTK
jgi:hypothetical protein